MPFPHGENHFSGSLLVPHAVSNIQYVGEEPSAQLEGGAVGQCLPQFQQRPRNSAVIPENPFHQTPFHQNQGYSDPSGGDHFAATGTGSDNHSVSFYGGRMSGELQPATSTPFAFQDQGQSDPGTQQLHPTFPGSSGMGPMFQPVINTLHPASFPEISQSTPVSSGAIISSSGIHLCHGHYNLIQSLADFKPSISFHINTTECIICSSISQGVPINRFSIITNTPPTVRRDRTDLQQPQPQPQGRFYCSFEGCNRAINGRHRSAGDQPFNRKDNRDKHERDVHGVPRRRQH